MTAPTSSSLSLMKRLAEQNRQLTILRDSQVPIKRQLADLAEGRVILDDTTASRVDYLLDTRARLLASLIGQQSAPRVVIRPSDQGDDWATLPAPLREVYAQLCDAAYERPADTGSTGSRRRHVVKDRKAAEFKRNIDRRLGYARQIITEWLSSGESTR